jgi:CheY-like chemotaxis protein
MTNRKVLLVEDEKALLNRFAAKIRREGYEVLTAENGAEAWKIFQKTHFLVVVTDLGLPLKDGMEILQDIKKSSPATRVIILTGFGNTDKAIQALNSQAFFWIQKGGPGTGEKLLQAIEKAFTEAETQIQAEREMLSFLTHTLFTTISGGPKTVERVLKYAQSALGARYHENDVYKTINNIARLKAIFISMANLLDAYRIFINEPDAFSQKWHEERQGKFSLSDLFSAVLIQIVASLLFEEFNLEQLQRILATQEERRLAVTRESFLNEIFWSEETALELNRILNWLDHYLPAISLEIQGPEPGFDPEGVRRPFLLAILAEIVYNALKYTDLRESIKLEWTKRDDTYVFSCRNTFSAASTLRKGSQKGLTFVDNLTQMIEGIRLFRKIDDNVFTIELYLQPNVLAGGSAQ